MSDADVRRTIAKLAAEETSLMETAKRVDVRLAQVRTAKAALTALISDDPVEFEGKLADAIRTALKNRNGKSLSPTEVRDAVKALGYNLSQHTNEMAAIHSVLKRLVDMDEVKTKTWRNVPGTRYYRPGIVLSVPPATIKISDGPPIAVLEETPKPKGK